MKAETAARYAIYYAPSEGSALSAFGRRWLGRDDAGTDMDRRREVPGFSRERLCALTATARKYGFHATLKAPFRLATTTSPEELAATVAAFARRRAPAQAPPLRLTAIAAFLALAPRGPACAVDRLAADCVRAFDRFSAPPSHRQAAHRRAAGLSPRQMALLARWGYPYVMQEFRFHMTLTDAIAEPAERRAIMQRIMPLVAPLERAPPRIDQICLFRQDQPGQPLVIERRFRLAGPHAVAAT